MSQSMINALILVAGGSPFLIMLACIIGWDGWKEIDGGATLWTVAWLKFWFLWE